MNNDLTRVETSLSGYELLNDPLLNKGTAFTEEERDEFDLHGLLPPHVSNFEDQVKRLAALASVLVMAAAEALAQDQQATARRIVVSIPDRKLAVMKGDKVVKIFPTAVGAPVSPSPSGSYTIVNQATGTITSLPAVGKTERQGGVLYQVSGAPVVLLYGSVPDYRDMSEGLSGGDVREFNDAPAEAPRASLAPPPGSDYDDDVTMPVHRDAPKVGRNDPCPCGSGKKYKKCCGL